MSAHKCHHSVVISSGETLVFSFRARGVSLIDIEISCGCWWYHSVCVLVMNRDKTCYLFSPFPHFGQHAIDDCTTWQGCFGYASHLI